MAGRHELTVPLRGAGADARAAHYREQGWWPGQRLADAFERLVVADPNALAVTDTHGRELTRAELWEHAGRLADELTARGVEPERAVVLLLPNTADFLVAFLAILRIGAVGAPAPITTDAATLAYIVELIDAQAVIVAESHRGRPLGDEARAVADASTPAPLVLTLAPGSAPRWSGTAPIAPAQPAWIDQIMFTSSTTGRPKAVAHSADTLAALNIGFRDRYDVGPDAPIFMPSPLGHSVGTIHGARLSLFTGAALIVQDVWDPRVAIALAARHRCAFTAAATPFLKDLLDAPHPEDGVKLASVRTFLCGGAAVPPAFLERAARELPHTFVTVLWGMTEGGVTTCPPDTPLARVTTSAGFPLPGLELAILDPDGDGRLEPGRPGELAMRGPGVFLGYVGQESLYRSLVTADGYFRTGDLAQLDDEGFLHLTGRLKDLIIRGGVNLSPVPLEHCLASHRDVAEVAVVGAPDERLGERICAVIVAAGERVPTLEQLQAYALDAGLSRRQLPESLRIVKAMPKTAAGKIRKHVLKEELETR